MTQEDSWNKSVSVRVTDGELLLSSGFVEGLCEKIRSIIRNEIEAALSKATRVGRSMRLAACHYGAWSSMSGNARRLGWRLAVRWSCRKSRTDRG